MNNRLKICIDHNFLGSGINYKRQWEDSQERQQRKNKSHLGLQENVSIYEDIRFHHVTYISTSSCFITWISKCSETANISQSIESFISPSYEQWRKISCAQSGFLRLKKNRLYPYEPSKYIIVNDNSIMGRLAINLFSN